MTTFAHIATARIILFILSALILHAVPTRACTSALVRRNRSASGKMLLWKHRDTSSVRTSLPAAASVFDFVALFQRRRLHPVEAWAGVNRAGFCRNEHRQLQPRPGHRRPARPREPDRPSPSDHAPTIGDFENMLDTLPRPLGVQANFGAMDRTGHGAYYRPTTTDTANSPHSRLTAHTHQFLLLRTVRSRTRTRALRRGHNPYRPPMRHHPHSAHRHSQLLIPPHSGRNSYIDRGQYIPRYSTSASIVIDEDGHIWIKPGYPPLSPVTYRADIDSIPSSLLPDRLDGWHSPAWRTIEKHETHTSGKPATAPELLPL